MNREEILEKSRRENKNQDVYEQEVLKQSNEVAAFVMVLLAAVFWLVQIFTDGGINYGLWALVFAQNMTTLWVKYTKLRRRRELIFAIMYTAAVILASACHIHKLVTAPAAV
ncbi:DUF6442 family protein [Acutalibacter muris]|jgi:thiol:disulfide interchange protein|uniref:DUF6442 family protein n=1 Tax=Acutalibacter muris TaxID=1796620 RepID=UPI0026F38FBF|nr:DUF6442 family protein [Acutalibacter muris]